MEKVSETDFVFLVVIHIRGLIHGASKAPSSRRNEPCLFRMPE
jgi:hypothetical protein